MECFKFIYTRCRLAMGAPSGDEIQNLHTFPCTTHTHPRRVERGLATRDLSRSYNELQNPNWKSLNVVVGSGSCIAGA